MSAVSCSQGFRLRHKPSGDWVCCFGGTIELMPWPNSCMAWATAEQADVVLDALHWRWPEQLEVVSPL